MTTIEHAPKTSPRCSVCASRASAYVAKGATYCTTCYRSATDIHFSAFSRIECLFRFAGRRGRYCAGFVTWGGAQFQIEAAGPDLRAAIDSAIVTAA